MPPVNQPGSRAGLVTAVVVLGILFVISMIFAFYFNADARKNEKLVTDTKSKYREIIAEPEMTGPAQEALKASARDNTALGLTEKTPTFDVALRERDLLINRIAGSKAESFAAADAAAQSAVDAVVEQFKTAKIPEKVSTSSLTEAISSLATLVETRERRVAELQQQLSAAHDETAKAIERAETQIKAAEERADLAREDAGKQVEGEKTASKATTDAVAAIQAQIDKERQDYAKVVSDLQVQINELNANIKKKEDQGYLLTQKLAELRPSLEDIQIRRPDGNIISVPSKDVVYINLGASNSITPGLTFEVYDKNEGIPSSRVDPQNPEATPSAAGKASIEVNKVGATNSECRVIKTKPGETIMQGDIIVNLVYDQNTKYNFLVYGKFDMDQNGVATDQDAAIVKRLITQWGGKLMDKVNVDTDFVVLGTEPVVEDLTDEIKNNPEEYYRWQEAQKAAEAYAQVKMQAVELHVPVLNQNRFLYYIGYYDQSQR